MWAPPTTTAIFMSWAHESSGSRKKLTSVRSASLADSCEIRVSEEVPEEMTTILQFLGICTLMRNDDCFQQSGGPDIPYSGEGL